MASMLFKRAFIPRITIRCFSYCYTTAKHMHPHQSSFFIIYIFSIFHFQNLLISDQSSVIIKSLSKLPKSFDIVVYPTLLCLTCDNDGAKNVIGKEFDLKVRFMFRNIQIGIFQHVFFFLSNLWLSKFQ